MSQPIPRRSVQLHIRIEADSRQELARMLDNLAFQVEANEHFGTGSISGGYASGYVVDLFDVDERITHDSWYEALEAYLKAKKDGSGEDGAPASSPLG